jgi:MFS family permease
MTADRLQRLRKAVALDLTPLRVSRDYRLLYIGRTVSYAGSMLTTVAFPYQVYQRTHSTLAVGLLGAVELVPLLFMALAGGAFADAHDRRRLLILSEVGLACCSLVLVALALMTAPPVWALFVLAAISAGLSGFQRPALQSMAPRLLPAELMPAAAALESLGSTFAAIGGPAIGGILISTVGLAATYALDAVSFGISIFVVAAIRRVAPPADAERPSLGRVIEGFRYALSRKDLLGTYLIDMNAMFFGMPYALFPAIAERLGGGKVLGLLYAAPAFGAFLASATSGWTGRVHRHGRAIAIAAAFWGVAIIAFGFTTSLWPAFTCLALAGAADMVSAVYRMTIWNQTIPDGLRGRLAGIEQISYMSGPLLGNVEAGLVASFAGIRGSVVSGGILCVAGTAALCWLLPDFVKYDARTSVHRKLKQSEMTA